MIPWIPGMSRARLGGCAASSGCPGALSQLQPSLSPGSAEFLGQSPLCCWDPTRADFSWFNALESCWSCGKEQSEEQNTNPKLCATKGKSPALFSALTEAH